MRLHKRMRRGRQGFTLIELLVVIAIIGILAAVVLVSLNAARVRGRDGRRLSDLQNIAIAMEIFFDQNGYYPENANSAVDWGANFDTIVTALSAANLIPVAAIDDPLGDARREYGAQTNIAIGATAYILSADLEQTNQACNNDFDGTDLDGTGTECADVAACDGDDTAGSGLVTGADFCIIQQQ